MRAGNGKGMSEIHDPEALEGALAFQRAEIRLLMERRAGAGGREYAALTREIREGADRLLELREIAARRREAERASGMTQKQAAAIWKIMGEGAGGPGDTGKARKSRGQAQ